MTFTHYTRKAIQHTCILVLRFGSAITGVFVASPGPGGPGGPGGQASFWTAEEIDLAQDNKDWEKLTEGALATGVSDLGRRRTHLARFACLMTLG